MHSTEAQANQAAPQLLSTELRVLGVLMEKQLTTPDQYPLTLNSVITACNQKSSREPITNLTQGEVARALQELDTKHFVRKERSSRAEKFTQQFMNHLQLGRKQQALLCVMMLRGPQSLSELNTRTQRMCDFTDKEDLEHTVDRLCTREIPYVVRLTQQPGQRGERFAHLFNSDATRGGTRASISGSETRIQEQAAPTESMSDATHTNTDQAKIEQQVVRLNKQVETLEAQTSELKQQINKLYDLTGHSKAELSND